MERKLLWFCIVLTFSGTFAFSQSAESAEALIVYAEGSEFSVSRADSTTTYSVPDDDVIGLSVLRGDVVSTETGTFLELSLDTTGHILKIAENTTFQLKTSGTGRDNDVVVLYGRVRAKVTKLTGNSTFTVRGQNAVAGVRGTDFGFDVIARKITGGPVPVTTNVYCFEGSVEVSAPSDVKTDAATETNREPVLIEANQMVTIDKPAETGAVVTPVVKQGILPEILEYWEKQPIKADPLSRPAAKIALAETPVENAREESSPVPVEEPVPADTPTESVTNASVAAPEVPQPSLTPANLKLKNDLVVTSITMFVSGGVTGAAGLGLFFFTPGNGETSNTRNIGTALMSCAGTLLATGAIAVVKSLLISGK